MPAVHVTCLSVSFNKTGDSICLITQWDRLIVLLSSNLHDCGDKSNQKASDACVSLLVLSAPEH